jgi:hypothetical protein
VDNSAAFPCCTSLWPGGLMQPIRIIHLAITKPIMRDEE